MALHGTLVCDSENNWPLHVTKLGFFFSVVFDQTLAEQLTTVTKVYFKLGNLGQNLAKILTKFVRDHACLGQ